MCCHKDLYLRSKRGKRVFMDKNNNLQNKRGIVNKVLLVGFLLIVAAIFAVVNAISLFMLNLKTGYILISISAASLLMILTCIYLVFKMYEYCKVLHDNIEKESFGRKSLLRNISSNSEKVSRTLNDVVNTISDSYQAFEELSQTIESI